MRDGMELNWNTMVVSARSKTSMSIEVSFSTLINANSVHA